MSISFNVKEKVKNTIKEYGMIEKGDKVLVIYDGNIINDYLSTTSSTYPVRILDAEIGLCE